MVKSVVNRSEIIKKHKEAKAGRITLKLEKAKERRIKKFTDTPVEEMSGTTRRLMFKYTGDRKYTRKRKTL